MPIRLYSTGEMPIVQHLLYKHEDLVRIPRTQVKSQAQPRVPVTQDSGRQRQQGHRGLVMGSLALGSVSQAARRRVTEQGTRHPSRPSHHMHRLPQLYARALTTHTLCINHNSKEENGNKSRSRYEGWMSNHSKTTKGHTQEEDVRLL